MYERFSIGIMRCLLVDSVEGLLQAVARKRVFLFGVLRCIDACGC